MTVKIESKIVGYEVVKDEDDQAAEAALADMKTAPATVVQMHEQIKRPETLRGATYKIKTPLSDHALYLTINDIVLNEGTENEIRRPFEIFINSKSMEHFQWIVGMTLIISAIFRKGGDVTFLVDELRSVFDPRGGYFKKGGKYMPSLVAEIGDCIEKHLISIGMLQPETLDEAQQALIDEKKAQLASQDGGEPDDASSDYPPEATLCPKCHTKAVIRQNGCEICLSCSDSRCG